MDVPKYSPETGIPIQWDDGFVLQCTAENGEVVIAGNPAGLRSLARHLLVLAQTSVPVGSHVHLDDLNSLEPDSASLVIERRSFAIE
jgi:hypothetical protein